MANVCNVNGQDRIYQLILVFVGDVYRYRVKLKSIDWNKVQNQN